jgi:hypothetical protein
VGWGRMRIFSDSKAARSSRARSVFEDEMS